MNCSSNSPQNVVKTTATEMVEFSITYQGKPILLPMAIGVVRPTVCECATQYLIPTLI